MLVNDVSAQRRQCISSVVEARAMGYYDSKENMRSRAFAIIPVMIRSNRAYITPRRPTPCFKPKLSWTQISG